MHTRYFIVLLSLSLSPLLAYLGRHFALLVGLESFPRFGGLHVCDFSFYQPMWMYIVLANHGR